MPVTLRYSASLDQTYEDHGHGATVGQSLPDLPSASSSPAPPSDGGAGSDSRHHLLGSPLPGGSNSNSGSVSGHGGGSSDGGGGSGSRMTYHDRTSSMDSLNDGSLSSGCGSVGSGGGGNHSRQLSSESCAEFIPTRTVKSTVKPAFNPMQFVKTGASQLGRKAEAQIKRYEEVKKVKELVREEEEEWQSNLDNWKSKRRDFSKKTVTRAEEIKQLNEVEHERSSRSRRNKTFNEMMEERSKRASSTSILPVWNDDDAMDGDDNDDVIDRKDPTNNNNNNNNSSKSDVSFESSGSDHVFHEDDNDLDTQRHQRPNQSNGNGSTISSNNSPKSNGIQHDSDASSDNGSESSPTTATLAKAPANGHAKLGNGDVITPTASSPKVTTSSSSVSEEYTFDKAIQSYTQYAESRTKGTTRVTETKSTTTVASTSSSTSAHGQVLPVNGRANGTAARGAESPVLGYSEPTKTTVAVQRDEGEEMMILVCLKRGSETKDFGFATKSVAGFGTGPFVESVSVASPADEAGLRVADEILAINGESCTTKRTHSAIVFAIKQAVYTGRLELSVYRYKNPELALLKTTSLASNSSFRGADKPNHPAETTRGHKFAATNGSNGDLSPAAKVDVVQRRSVFESSAARSSPDRSSQNRRSLDISTKFKDKLASFEQLDSNSGATTSLTDSDPVANNSTSFKEKLASFQSLDSLDSTTKSRQWNSGSPDAQDASRLRAKRNSYDNLLDQPEVVPTTTTTTTTTSEVASSSSHEVSEKRMTFETRQSFERTQSCQFLDSMTSDENETSCEEPQRHLVEEDGRRDSELIDSIEQQQQQQRHLSSEELVGGGGVNERDSTDLTGYHDTRDDELIVEADASATTDFSSMESDTRDATVTSYDHIGDRRYQDVSSRLSSNDSSPSGKSAFELADSLEETAFVGSMPSSPRDVDANPVAVYSDVDVALAVGGNNNSNDDFDGLVHYRPARSTSVVSDLSPTGELNLELLTINVDLSVADDVVVMEDFEMPVTALAPPSEKPPPPPMDPEGGTPDQTAATRNVNLRRVDSTKRIRKEISKRRSDFLGIDGDEVQNYIDNEISNVSPPPKMDEFLKADRELSEQCRQELLRSEQDRRKASDEESLSNHHAKQSSVSSSLNLSNDDCYSEENFTNTEITLLEREIITNLEWEEEQQQQQQQKYQQIQQPRQKHESGSSTGDVKNKDVEMTASPPTKLDHSQHSDEAQKLREREEALRRQEEMLQLEKKKLREEQESLLKIKEAYQKQIEEHNQRSQVAPPVHDSHEHHLVLSTPPSSPQQQQQQQQQPQRQSNQLNVHQSQPSLVLSTPPPPAQQEVRGRQAPMPPNKPRLVSPAGLKLDLSGHDRSSSPQYQQPQDADHAPRRHQSGTDERLATSTTHQSPEPPATPSNNNNSNNNNNNSHTPTTPQTPTSKKQALYALSASPKAKLLDGDEWMAARRQHENNNNTSASCGNLAALGAAPRSNNYNQHWVVQEAEFRRLHAPERTAVPTQQPANDSPSLRRSLSAERNFTGHSPPANQRMMAANDSTPPSGVPSHHQHHHHHYDTPQNVTAYQNYPQSRPPPPNKPLPPIPTTGSHAVTSPVPPQHHQQQQQQQQRLNGQSSAAINRYAVGLPPHPQGALPAPPTPPHGQQQQQQHYHQSSPSYQSSPQQQQQQHHASGAHQMALQSHYGVNGAARNESEVRMNSSGTSAFSPPMVPKTNGHGGYDKETQMLSVSGKKKCSHCNEELGRGAAMIIESLQLFYHINCFKCCVCHTQLGNGSSGADVRVRSQKLHCHNCYSNDEGLKFSKV